METDVNKATSLLCEKVNLAVINGTRIETFCERGIKMLLHILKTDPALLAGASVADKIVGKAAAMMFIKGGVKEVYAEVLSESAVEILKEHRVPFTYGKLTPRIINRAGTGLCPMETAVLSVDDPEQAFVLLCKTAAALAADKKN